MYSQLGDIVFQQALSPNSQEVASSAAYAEHALISGKPRLQRIGSSLIDLKLAIKLHSNFCDPQSVVDQLSAYKENGDSIRYINGAGRLMGVFVLVSLTQTDAAWGPNGSIMECDIELELKEAQSAAVAPVTGFAISSSSPVESIQSIGSNTAVAAAANSVVGIQAGTSDLEMQIALAQTDGSNLENYLSKASTQADNVSRSMNDAVQSVNQTTSNIYDQTRQFAGACESGIQSVADLKAALIAGDFQGILDALAGLTQSVSGIFESSEVLAAIQGSRIPVPTNG
jgi:phage protein U